MFPFAVDIFLGFNSYRMPTSKRLVKMANELSAAGFKVSQPLNDIRFTVLVNREQLAAFRSLAEKRNQKIKVAMAEAIQLYLDRVKKT